MSDAQAVKSEAYRVLKDTHETLTSADFLWELQSATPAQRKVALQAITDSALAIAKFRNARLADIVAEMKANNKGIEAATTDLREALTDLNKIKALLDTATAFLKIVGRVIAAV